MRLIVFVLAILISFNLLAQKAEADDLTDIKETLRSFKDAYLNRDTSSVNQWFDSLFYDNVEIIGTYAVEPNTKEWKTGKKASIELFLSDWINWGDVEINLDKANINSDQDFAWVSVPALVTRNPNNSNSKTSADSFSRMLKNFEKIIDYENEKYTEKLKLLQIAYYANLQLFQYERGEEYIWPIRISGILRDCKLNSVYKY